ncbi:SRPBCC family protein [Lysobacter korlensis]|uniref:SRPBCC family protein n=1 Tax=Lysobacter korlensis TaxID=553636 RepID=A0ABV6S282_9GAMM
MSTVEKSIDVNVPITIAYNQWTQFEQFPRFMGGVEKITQINDTLTHWEVSIAGIDREFDAEITEQHPDERIAWRSVDGESHAGVVTFHRVEDAVTRINVQIDWKPKDLLEKVGSVLQVDDIQIGNDLKNFKKLIESQGVEDGAWRGDVDRAPDATGR